MIVELWLFPHRAWTQFLSSVVLAVALAKALRSAWKTNREGCVLGLFADVIGMARVVWHMHSS